MSSWKWAAPGNGHAQRRSAEPWASGTRGAVQGVSRKLAMSDGCAASGVTVMVMYGKSGRPQRISWSWALPSTAKTLTFAYSPTQRQMWRQCPERCHCWE